MNILISPDKFKGSLTAREVCEAVAKGLHEINPMTSIETVPLADGGEGTCDLLTEWYDGRKIKCEVHGPLFSPVSAYYGISKNGDIAFVEMAVASGLTLLTPGERNPLLTTSLGTGELIANALDQGVKRIILGIGGSATNDAGIGMAQALGYEFCDVDGDKLKPIGENLIHLHHIKTGNLHPRLKDVQVVALCDVTNPLYGPEGAAYVYGSQKGASDSGLQLLDAGLRNFRRIVHKHLKISVDFPGAGAAGGLGAGAKVFLQATMEKGIDYMTHTTQLEEKIRKADLVFTGEGKIDNQTFSGKVISEVARMARLSGKPVIAVCGRSDLPESELRTHGVIKVISLVNDTTSVASAIQNASALITRKVSEECKSLMKE